MHSLLRWHVLSDIRRKTYAIHHLAGIAKRSSSQKISYSNFCARNAKKQMHRPSSSTSSPAYSPSPRPTHRILSPAALPEEDEASQPADVIQIGTIATEISFSELSYGSTSLTFFPYASSTPHLTIPLASDLHRASDPRCSTLQYSGYRCPTPSMSAPKQLAHHSSRIHRILTDGFQYGLERAWIYIYTEMGNGMPYTQHVCPEAACSPFLADPPNPHRWLSTWLRKSMDLHLHRNGKWK